MTSKSAFCFLCFLTLAMCNPSSHLVKTQLFYLGPLLIARLREVAVDEKRWEILADMYFQKH